ncbi:MAG: hypothetical protein LAT55_06295 [Opitutales bacterium]|nr:hypothetical protein [Opitutales bacterium]
MSMRIVLSSLGALMILLGSFSYGESPPRSLPGPEIEWRLITAATTRASFDDVEGDVRFTRIRPELHLTQNFGPGFFGILNLSAERDFYSIRGTATPGTFTFDQASRLSVGFNLQKVPLERWGFFAMGVLGLAAEDDGRFSDGMYGFGGAGVSTRLNENVVVGLGLGGSRNLERSDSLFPLPFLRWQITEDLLLTTRNGAILRYQPEEHWALSWKTLYENREWALGQTGTTSQGAFRDRYISSGLATEYTLSPGWIVRAQAKALFLRKNEIRDGNGNQLFSENANISSFFEISSAYQF